LPSMPREVIGDFSVAGEVGEVFIYYLFNELICTVCVFVDQSNTSLMAIFTSEATSVTMRPHLPTFTTDNVLTSKAAGLTAYELSSTADTSNDTTHIFLQTAGAKAIAGVFAFASILVTCVQVRCHYI